MSIYLQAVTTVLSVTIRAIDTNVRYAQGAHTEQGTVWFSSPMGPIPGYPARVPSVNRVRTVESVTPQANALRAQSNLTLRYIGAVGIIARTDGEWERIHALSAKPDFRFFPRGQSIGIAAEDAHCLNLVRESIRDDIISDAFVRSYLETALWSSIMMPEDSEVSDLSYERADCDPSDVSLETAIGAKRDCDAFQLENETDLDEIVYGETVFNESLERLAHCFWLSRNGHGAGFFDRGDDVGERLQDGARAFGEVNLYHVGDTDDAVIYSDADVDTFGPFDLGCIWS